jgi:putative ATPase
VSLFDEGEGLYDAASTAPLAARLRPRSVDDVIGQRQLLGEGGPLRRLAEQGASQSVILIGPPGSGKTTIAHLLAKGRRFRELSAVSAGVKEVRAVIEEARQAQSGLGERTVLFLDEVHRFSKAQQDVLLPAVENGWLTLIAATTENPFFSIVSPLLSRSLLLRLEPLTEDDIRAVLRRALDDPRGFGGKLTLTPEAEQHLVTVAGGDARRALTALEAPGVTEGTLDLPTLERAVDRAAVRYDRDGDQHYDVVSAFIKSMRGGDVDAALHYLARMLEAGEDARFIARRIVILASEDIGMADPSSLQVAVAAASALELVGLPEAQLNLAQAVIHCSLAPKSNAVIAALGRAQADVRAGRTGQVPPHLRDAHYPGAKKLQHGRGYRYPHDFPGGVVAQQYAPDSVAGRVYYEPTEREPVAARRAAYLREVLGTFAGTDAAGWRPRCRPDEPSEQEQQRLGGAPAGDVE